MAKLSTEKRKQLPDSAFGIPEKRMYPLYKLDENDNLVPDKAHIESAVKLFGHASDADKPKLARNILKAAHEADMDTSGWDRVNAWAKKEPTKEAMKKEQVKTEYAKARKVSGDVVIENQSYFDRVMEYADIVLEECEKIYDEYVSAIRPEPVAGILVGDELFITEHDMIDLFGAGEDNEEIIIEFDEPDVVEEAAFGPYDEYLRRHGYDPKTNTIIDPKTGKRVSAGAIGTNKQRNRRNQFLKRHKYDPRTETIELDIPGSNGRKTRVPFSVYGSDLEYGMGIGPALAKSDEEPLDMGIFGGELSGTEKPGVYMSRDFITRRPSHVEPVFGHETEHMNQSRIADENVLRQFPVLSAVRRSDPTHFLSPTGSEKENFTRRKINGKETGEIRDSSSLTGFNDVQQEDLEDYIVDQLIRRGDVSERVARGLISGGITPAQAAKNQRLLRTIQSIMGQYQQGLEEIARVKSYDFDNDGYATQGDAVPESRIARRSSQGGARAQMNAYLAKHPGSLSEEHDRDSEEILADDKGMQRGAKYTRGRETMGDALRSYFGSAMSEGTKREKRSISKKDLDEMEESEIEALGLTRAEWDTLTDNEKRSIIVASKLHTAETLKSMAGDLRKRIREGDKKVYRYGDLVRGKSWYDKRKEAYANIGQQIIDRAGIDAVKKATWCEDPVDVGHSISRYIERDGVDDPTFQYICKKMGLDPAELEQLVTTTMRDAYKSYRSQFDNIPEDITASHGEQVPYDIDNPDRRGLEYNDPIIGGKATIEPVPQELRGLDPDTVSDAELLDRNAVNSTDHRLRLAEENTAKRRLEEINRQRIQIERSKEQLQAQIQSGKLTPAQERKVRRKLARINEYERRINDAVNASMSQPEDKRTPIPQVRSSNPTASEARANRNLRKAQASEERMWRKMTPKLMDAAAPEFARISGLSEADVKKILKAGGLPRGISEGDAEEIMYKVAQNNPDLAKAGARSEHVGQQTEKAAKKASDLKTQREGREASQAVKAAQPKKSQSSAEAAIENERIAKKRAEALKQHAKARAAGTEPIPKTKKNSETPSEGKTTEKKPGAKPTPTDSDKK